jgi:gliding motility-associated-like protein
MGNYGTWTITDTCLEYTAGPVKGTDTLCIKACDTTGICQETTVIVTVTGLPPVAVKDSVFTEPGTPVIIRVVDNDSAFDNDAVSLCDPDAIVLQPAHGTIIVNSDGTITYTPSPEFGGVDSFQYQICDPEGNDTGTVYIYVAGCDIPNGISPNGDGINDVFVIRCAAGAVSINVFNRWGIEVYRSDNYLNDWDGTYNGGPLPDGTYYYLLKYTDTDDHKIDKAGFITIHR